MFVVDAVLAPYRATKLLVQVVGDLHEFAEHVREHDDPFTQLRVAIVDGLEDLDALTATAVSVDTHLAHFDERVGILLREVSTLISTVEELIRGGADLTATAQVLDRHAAELVDGGRDLTVTAKSLDVHAAELIDGGEDLTVTAKHLDGNAAQLNELAASLDASLKLFRAALPQLLGALDTVEELEDSLETVAETIEPLQKTAEKVGRVTQRFSRSD